MYYDIDPDGRLIVQWPYVNADPDFDALIKSYGKNAFHYLILWASPLSPYFRTDEHTERHKMIMEAMKNVATEKGRTIKVPLYQQAEFKLAEKKLRAVAPEIEAREESNFGRIRRVLNSELETIMEAQEKGTSIIDQIDKISEIIKALAGLAKEHKNAREALNQRIQSDDSPAPVFNQR